MAIRIEHAAPVPEAEALRRPPSRGWRVLLAAVSCVLASSCTDYYTLDLPDINLDQPDDLPQRLAAFRSGGEKWLGDPRSVADVAIRRYLDVPWSPEPFRPSLYQVLESPEWGTYVVRGYVYPSGNLTRYRVKVRPYQEIWYPIQISRYKRYTIDEDAVHPLGEH
ncbi:MAG TPA: hypothetical protein VMU54_00555 [Planctomycetota bacterium]|nr:hypothetical protein [Planctomycetota bacterium]